MQRKSLTRLWFLTFAVLLSPALAYCQATEGTILGSVQDRSGGGVPNATVEVTSEDTGARRQTVADQLGEYVVTNLPLGRYAVSVEAKGFKKAVRTSIAMTVKARIRVDLTLEVGEVNQSVEVTGQAPLLKTDTPELGGVLTRETLQEIPVFGRNYLALSALVPGTTRGPKADRRRDFAGEAVTVAGLSSEANNFIIDGISNNNEFNGGMGVAPAIDGLQEFAIQTSQYSAEFGRAGGGVVNIAIKSGTNRYHGFGYDYLRNNKLDARPFDFTGTNPASAPIRRNQFGAGLGGPIRRNKIFLFGNYEGIRFPNNAITSNIVPTPAQKRGDFTSTPTIVYADPATTRTDPATPTRQIRTPFPGNIIPVNRQSPIGVRLLRDFPDPNYRDPNPNVRNDYLVTESNVDTLNSYNIKTDVNLRRSDTLAAHITEQRASRARSSWMPNSLIGATAQINGINSGINETHVISPTTVNEFRFGYNYTNSGNAVLLPVNTLSEFNIPGIANFPAAAAYPDLRVRNMTRTRVTRPIASVGTPFLIVEHSFQWLDTVSKQMGSHALKMGAEVTRIRSERLQGFPGNAQITTSAAYTTPVIGQSLEALRDGTADMLMDSLSDYQTVYVLDATRLRGTRFSWFAQDDWRVTRKLSLSLGLRHDIFTPFGELRNRMTNFDVSGGVMVLPDSTRSAVAGALGLPNGNLPPTFRYTGLDQVVPHTNYTNFGPRIGFAYAATSKFVVRGGYGIFYGVTVGNNASNAGTNAPFYTQVSAGTAELDKPLLMSAGFPAGGAFATLASNGIAPYYQPVDRHDPYTQKWSLNLQWSPIQRMVFEAGYTGQRALAFPALVRLNFPAPGPGNIQARRPYPALAGSTAYLPVNDSNYNGLELSVKLLHFHGLTLQSAFSFSKVLGYQDGIDGGILSDPYNYRYDYGPQNFDFRKRWVIGYIYRLPSARGLPAIARYALGGWETSGLVTLQGGPPFTVLVSGQVLNNGLDANNRANALRDPNLSNDQRTRQRWFDTTAFTAPPIYVWGSQGKNTLRGPGSAVVDFSLQKSVPVREGLRFTVRMEANNFFNRVNLGLPAATLNAANFGAIRTIDSGPRLIQLAGRFDF